MPHETVGPEVTLVLAAVKTLVLVAGGAVTYYAGKAYRRTRNRALGLLAAGFATVTVGALLGGAVYELLNVALAIGVVIEGLFMLLGFSLIAYSLRVR